MRCLTAGFDTGSFGHLGQHFQQLGTGRYLDYAVLIVVSNRNPLHDIARDAPAPAIVNLGGPGVGVAGEVLHVLQRDVLIEQVGHHRDPEAVRREEVGQARVLEPPLEHFAAWNAPGMPPASVAGACRRRRGTGAFCRPDP